MCIKGKAVSLHIRNLMLVALCLVVQTRGVAETSFGQRSLRQSVDRVEKWSSQLAEAVLLTEPFQSKPVSGRLYHESALLIKEGSLVWQPHELGTSYLVEFWFSPHTWNPIGKERVDICSLTINSRELRLTKDADAQSLSFSCDGERGAIYPTYAWDDVNWTNSMIRSSIMLRSVGWHHVCVAVSGGKILPMVDGFPVRQIAPFEFGGTLTRLEFSGNPGTKYSAPLLTRGASLDKKLLRERYRALFMHETQTRPQLATAAYCRKAPEPDGVLSPGEWANAAILEGWLDPATGILDSDARGFLMYDEQKLHLALSMPLRSKQTNNLREPLFDVFIGPPFISGEEPREIYQFSGTADGGKKQFQLLPELDNNWQCEWKWCSGVQEGRQIVEFVLDLTKAGLPSPAQDAVWSLRVVDRASGAVWSQVDGNPQGMPSMADLHFNRWTPIVQCGAWHISAERISIPVTLAGLQKHHKIMVSMYLYGGNDLLPTIIQEREVVWQGDISAKIDLSLPIGAHKYGLVALCVREGKHKIRDIYYSSTIYPIPRTGGQL